MLELSPTRSLTLRLPNLPALSLRSKVIGVSSVSAILGGAIVGFHVPALIDEEAVMLWGNASSSAAHLLPVLSSVFQNACTVLWCDVVPFVALCLTGIEIFGLKKKQKEYTKKSIENVEVLQRQLYHLVFDRFYFCTKCDHKQKCIFSDASLMAEMIKTAFEDMNIDFRRLQKKALDYFHMRRKTSEITEAQYAEAALDFDLYDYPEEAEEKEEPIPVKAELLP